MRVKLQLIMCSDDGHEDTITDIVTLQKDSQRIEHLGLTIREAKQLLNTIQKHCCNTSLRRFSTRAQPARTAAPPSKPKAIIPVRSAPCLTPSNLPVHVSSFALVNGARPQRSGL
jgi:hypothetical protein